MDSCPGAAISVHDNQIRFDGDKCSGCMLCCASCPNDAFEFEGFDLEQGLQSLSKQQETVISCSRRPQVHPEEFVIPCIGGLSLEHLIYIGVALTGRVVFDMSLCGTCENESASRRFTALVSSLEGAGKEKLNAELTILTNTGDTRASCSETRRSFLAGIGNSLVTAVASRHGGDSGKSGDAVGRKRRVPNKVLLLKTLQGDTDQLRQELISSMCLHRIQVNGNCTGCPLCKGICPTGAIKIDTSGREKSLMVDHTICSGCGLCVAFCKHDALTLHKPARAKSLT